MVQKHNSRKGATLAEMMVVLAVIAIVSTMVISFSLLVSRRTAISAAKLNTMDDVSILESVTEAWILRMDGLGADIDAKDGGLTATVTDTVDGVANTKEEYHLIFTMLQDEGWLQGTLPNGEALSCRTKRVQTVTFAAMQREGDSDALYFCTVAAQIPRLDKGDPLVQTQTFCINPHVGETVGVTAGGVTQ